MTTTTDRHRRRSRRAALTVAATLAGGLALATSPAIAAVPAPGWSATPVPVQDGQDPSYWGLAPQADAAGNVYACGDQEFGNSVHELTLQEDGGYVSSDVFTTGQEAAIWSCFADLSGAVYTLSSPYSQPQVLTRWTQVNGGKYVSQDVETFSSDSFIPAFVVSPKGGLYAMNVDTGLQYFAPLDDGTFSSTPTLIEDADIHSGDYQPRMTVDRRGDVFVSTVQSLDSMTEYAVVRIAGETHSTVFSGVDPAEVAPFVRALTTDARNNLYLSVETPIQDLYSDAQFTEAIVRYDRTGTGYDNPVAVYQTDDTDDIFYGLAGGPESRVVALGGSSLTSFQGLASPSAPRSFEAKAGDGTVALRWNKPASDGGAEVTGYSVSIVTGTGSSTQSTQVCSGDSLTFTCSVGGLTNGRTYRFQVRAINSEGYSLPAGIKATPSLPVSFTTDLPATSAAAVKSTLTLSVVVAGDPAPKLRWQKSTDAGDTWTNVKGGSGVSSISTVVRSSTYGTQYRVVATQKGAAPVYSTATTVTAPQ